MQCHPFLCTEVSCKSSLTLICDKCGLLLGAGLPGWTCEPAVQAGAQGLSGQGRVEEIVLVISRRTEGGAFPSLGGALQLRLAGTRVRVSLGNQLLS